MMKKILILLLFSINSVLSAELLIKEVPGGLAEFTSIHHYNNLTVTVDTWYQTQAIAYERYCAALEKIVMYLHRLHEKIWEDWKIYSIEYPDIIMYFIKIPGCQQAFYRMTAIRK